MIEKSIKIYAERNTGSRYLQRLIESNLEVDTHRKPEYFKWLLRNISSPSRRSAVNDLYFRYGFSRNLGWKHSCVKSAEELRRTKLVQQRQLKFISLTKNPYSWLLSLHRRPYTQHYTKKPEFEKFLLTPWKTVARENIAVDVPSPIQLWNIKNASYFQLRDFDYAALRYEDLLADPEKVLGEIAKNLDLSWKRNSFTNHDKSTKNTNQTNHDYKQYYLEERWKGRLSTNAIALINSGIDRKLMEHHGYKIL